ncbi:hypothetical protein [Mucilaginibacter sp.]|uniref:hypothetical protein n=1 Tax=Mucilaginibacter sp. TaxID=1882438 RepID=UPI0025E4D83B|nr:hypothetical protein [Mucilaginibacter sp.]
MASASIISVISTLKRTAGAITQVFALFFSVVGSNVVASIFVMYDALLMYETLPC